jgi:UDP-N-acetyl-D-glucosamine dehydrogenase
VDRLAEALDRRFRKGLNGARILILGLAYKRNVEDIRESASFKLIELLEERGASVDYHDPHVPVIPVTREHGRLAGRRSVPLSAATLAMFDAALVSTDHEAVDYRLVAEYAALVVDTRNACARAGADLSRVVKA